MGWFRVDAFPWHGGLAPNKVVLLDLCCGQRHRRCFVIGRYYRRASMFNRRKAINTFPSARRGYASVMRREYSARNSSRRVPA